MAGREVRVADNDDVLVFFLLDSFHLLKKREYNVFDYTLEVDSLTLYTALQSSHILRLAKIFATTPNFDCHEPTLLS